MHAVGIKFVFLIQICQIWVEKNEVFFTVTKGAYISDRRKFSTPANYLQGYLIINIFAFKFMYVPAKGCLAHSLISECLFMHIMPFLKVS